MPKASPLQSNFNGGEFSRLLHGRVETDRYPTGLAVCKNFIPTIQGGLTKRSGTYFVAEAKDSTKAVRLQPFEFSTSQAYQLEFGDLYIRFFRNNGQIVESTVAITGATQASPGVITATAHGYSTGQEVFVSGVGGMTQLNERNFRITVLSVNTFSLQDMAGNNIDTTAYTAYTSGGTVARVYTLTTTYAEAHLFELNFVQSQDVLYIVHPSYAPRKLTRTGHTSWTLTACTFLDGPYLPLNTTSTTITCSATTGSVTVTASAALFAATDVGRHIRFYGGAWTWLKITAFTDSTHVTATVMGVAATTAAVTTWRLGLWSDTTGYPSCATFHEDRLCLAGPTVAPQRVDMSFSSDYENFAPTAQDGSGTVTDSHAVSLNLNANDVNSVRWLVSGEKGLLAGSVGREWAIRPSVQSEGISPSNVSYKSVNTYGSANIAPVVVGKMVLFVQRSKKKVRELSYFFEDDGFKCPDRTLIAEHMGGLGGFKQAAYQKNPQSIAWFVRNDGVLAGMTYEKEDDQLVVGWHRHVVGGVSDAADSAAQVESVACIPSPDTTSDEVWLVVKRRINGRTVRSIEYIAPFFDEVTEQRDAYFVDNGLTYDNPITITGITAANPAVVTAASHGLSNGDACLITGVLGCLDDIISETSGVNNKTFVARNVTANTFELELNGAAFDASGLTAYVSGGEVRKYVTTISGLWHLEGETVDILGDGAVQPAKTVASGRVTLSTRAATVHLGQGYQADGQMLRLEAGAADGTALGKTRRINRVSFLLDRTLGLKVGMNFTDLKEMTFRTTADPLTRAPALFSGILSKEIAADYDKDNQLAWRSSQPLPCTILAIAPQLHTEDR